MLTAGKLRNIRSAYWQISVNENSKQHKYMHHFYIARKSVYYIDIALTTLTTINTISQADGSERVIVTNDQYKKVI